MAKKKTKTTGIIIELSVTGENSGKFGLKDIQDAVTDLIASMEDVESYEIKVSSK